MSENETLMSLIQSEKDQLFECKKEVLEKLNKANKYSERSELNSRLNQINNKLEYINQSSFLKRKAHIIFMIQYFLDTIKILKTKYDFTIAEKIHIEFTEFIDNYSDILKPDEIITLHYKLKQIL
jgi:hypothetical protein